MSRRGPRRAPGVVLGHHPQVIALSPARQRHLFATATGLIAVEIMLFTLVIPALPVYAQRYGLSDSGAALIFAAYPAAQLLVAPAAARVVDRVGRRPAMVGGALTLVLATLAFAVVQNAWLLGAARGAQGLAAGLAWTAALAAVSDSAPAEELGYRIGLAVGVGGGAGLAGPPLGGVLIEVVGLEATFALAAILPALLAGSALLVPETRRPGTASPPLLPALVRILRRREARAGALALAAAAGLLALLEPLLPLDLDRRLSLEPAAVGAVFLVGLAANMLASPLAGRWSDRHGRRPAIATGGLLVALALPLTAHGGPVAVALAFGVVGAGLGTLAAPAGPLLTRAVDDAGLAGSYGLSAALLVAVFSAGYLLGPLGGAGLRVVMPYAGVAVVGALAAAAAASWAYRLLRAARVT